MTEGWTVGAAWVQAIGSVAAIGSAIWISQQQYRLARAERRQDRIDHISLLQGIANLAYHHVRQTAELVRTEGAGLAHGHFDRETGQNLSALLLQFDPQKLRSPPGALGVVSLANACARAADYAEAAGKLLHKGENAWVAMEDELEAWAGSALQARNAILEMTPEF